MFNEVTFESAPIIFVFDDTESLFQHIVHITNRTELSIDRIFINNFNFIVFRIYKRNDFLYFKNGWEKCVHSQIPKKSQREKNYPIPALN